MQLTRRIMLLRHAEKPDAAAGIGGVDLAGVANADSLSVRGWQRAGALAALFGPPHEGGRLQFTRPAYLFATAATPDAPSRRSEQTLAPLAQLIALHVSTEFQRGQEAALARRLGALPRSALVAWEHRGLAELARQLAGPAVETPAAWPAERFDMVWVFDFSGPRTVFFQVPQLLLAGDRSDPL